MFAVFFEYSETIFLSLLAFSVLFYVVKTKKDFFSPIVVYVFVQCFTLAVAYLCLDAAMTPFHLKTWLVWIGGGLSFCSGCILSLWQGKRRANIEREICVEQSLYNWKLHFVLSCVVLALYFFGVWGIIKTAGNLILLTGESSKWVSSIINYGIFPQFFSSAPLCVLLFGVASFKSINPVRWIRVTSLILAIFVSLFSIVAYPSRTSFFMCFGFFVLLYNYLKKKIPAVLITMTIFLGIGMFVLIALVRAQYDGGSSIENLTLKKAMSVPYSYVANNYWNLDYSLNPPLDRPEHPCTYGVDFFAGVLEYSGLPGAFRQSYRWDGLFNESVQKVAGYNTTGYLWEVYKDFRMPGVFLFPFFCGLGLSVLYSRMNKNKTPAKVMFYVFAIYFVGFWFFLAGYKQGIFWAWAFIILMITSACRTGKNIQ